MTDKRKLEIINCLLEVYENWNEDHEMTMFDLISGYNQNYPNPELIGGDWVIANVPELAGLPT